MPKVDPNIDPLWVVRLPEIHAVGQAIGAIVAAEFGQLEQIQKRHPSLEVVSVDEYPDYVAQMIRSAAIQNERSRD